MKSFIFSLLLLSAFASNLTFYRYRNGNISKDYRYTRRIEGPLITHKGGNGYTFILAGSHGLNLTSTSNETTNSTSFAIIGFTNRTIPNNHSFTRVGSCVRASWDNKEENVFGLFYAHQTWNGTFFEATCYGVSSNSSYVVRAYAERSNCSFYSGNASATRAAELIGKSGYTYFPDEVVNHAILGYAFIPTRKNCTWYLENLRTVSQFKPGLVIVGNDGKHCGIISNRTTGFIHSEPYKRIVMETPINMYRKYFRHGYSLKDSFC